MAGEWIKLEATTLDKPEVLRIARILKIDRDAALGKVVRLWSWFDANSVDGVVDGVVDADVDRMCFCPGFASACVAVGWLVVDEASERITLPNFERHNGETAKQRALKNRRQANWRAGVDGSVDKTSSTKASTRQSTKASTREEKRRDKEQEPPIPPEGGQVGKDVPAKRSRKPTEAMTYEAFVAACKTDGEKLIPADHAVFAFAQDTGIPVEFIKLAWREFSRQYRGSRKTQAGKRGWRQKFENCVRRNWYRLWWESPEGIALTTTGQLLKREMDSEQARREDAQPEDQAA